MAAKTGRRKLAGKQTARGPRGARGQRGARGPAGRAATRAEILAAVGDQLADIRRQLDIQLTRFGQLQMQVDHLQGLLKDAIDTPE